MKKVSDCTVNQIIWLNENNYLLELIAPDPLPEILPGNFAELRIDDSPDIFLRRPFTILETDKINNTIRFFIKTIGAGTRKLGTLSEGDQVNMIFPLGNSFSLPAKGSVLIVGGGSGIAPFILLAKELQNRDIPITFLFGGRTDQDILLIEQFKPFGEVFITTEDGSAGEQGVVTQHSVFNKTDDYTMIYACGPEPMMKAVGNIARHHNKSCEVSLENMMACGFGACLCCIVETKNGNQRVCTEGPVFNINDLTWQI